MKGELDLDFKAIFPHLGARGEGSKKFGKVHRLIRGYANSLGKRACELDLLDFIDEKKRVIRDFSLYVSAKYPNGSTRSSQISIIKKLAVDELELAASGDTAAASDMDFIVDPSKLKPHLRELWLLLPRVGGSHAAGKDRANLPLTPN